MDDVELAAHLVSEAAALAARMRAEGLAINQKTSVSDVVTDADHAAEEFIVQTLRRERPDDAILGEEGTNTPGTSGRRWVIDPDDGTDNFASGVFHWCSAVALVAGAPVQEDVLVGAVAHHDSGSVLVGGPDLPTMLNGQPVARLTDPAIGDISAATYLHPGFAGDPAVREPWLRATRLPATIRMLGSGSMEMVSVARGELGVYFQHSTLPWDWYPGTALIRGVGGVAETIDVDGKTWFVTGPQQAVHAIKAALQGQECS